MQRIEVAVIGACLVAGTLAGCTSSQPQGERSSSSDESTGVTITAGMLTYTPDTSEGGYPGMTAMFEGELTLTDGCLGVDGAPLIFPAQLVQWDGSTLTFGGRTYEMGDAVAVGGGELRADAMPSDIRAQCGNVAPILVSGPGS